MSGVLTWTGLASVLAYAVLAALFTLGFFLALPGPDGLGAPFVASTCRLGLVMPFGGSGAPGQCESSWLALAADAALVALIFLAIDRLARRIADIVSALGALVLLALWGYLAAGQTTDRVLSWVAILATAAAVGCAYAWRRTPRPRLSSDRKR